MTPEYTALKEWFQVKYLQFLGAAFQGFDVHFSEIVGVSCELQKTEKEEEDHNPAIQIEKIKRCITALYLSISANKFCS
jgi:hypothetical protein